MKKSCVVWFTPLLYHPSFGLTRCSKGTSPRVREPRIKEYNMSEESASTPVFAKTVWVLDEYDPISRLAIIKGVRSNETVTIEVKVKSNRSYDGKRLVRCMISGLVSLSDL